MDLKKKVQSSRALYLSHIEAVQNVVRLHKASSNAGLEEISSLASANAHFVEEVGSNDLSFLVSRVLIFPISTSFYLGFYDIFIFIVS